MKTYLLDANVLLHEANSILNFPKASVVLSVAVLEQVDRFKREFNDLGKNSRLVTQILSGLRSDDSLIKPKGAKLKNGGTIRIIINKMDKKSSSLKNDSPENNLLLHALALKEKGEEIVVVSKKLSVRLRANSLGLLAEDYKTDHFIEALTYKGYTELTLSKEQIGQFLEMQSLNIKNFKVQLRPNEYVVLLGDEKKTYLAKVPPRNTNIIVPLSYINEDLVGLTPLNIEQVFACEALLDDNIKLVTLQGKAGTGKTLLAIAAGLKKVLKDRKYDRVLVARPTVAMGKDLGYLPGTIEEKLRPWMQPIYDAVELIKNLDRQTHKPVIPNEIFESDSLQIEPLTYIRGRSIPNQFMIIDESQNLSPLEIKTIVSRVGTNTKIVLTGDPEQIDHPYMDIFSNGLSNLVNKFRMSTVAANILLTKGERSQLAEEAAKLL